MLRSILFILVLAGACCGPLSVCQQPQRSPANLPTAEFIMGPKFIFVPKGYFLLVRKGSEVGAIRFDTVTQDTKGLGKSTYESYFQGDRSGWFQGSGVVKRTGEIEIKPMRGFSHSLMWQPGENKLRVGTWWFGCASPSLVHMASHFADKEEGYEFAPTSAQNVGEIDTFDKRLQWFRYLDDQRISLAVSDLPK